MCVEADTGSWSSGTLSSNMESKTGSWVISTMSLSSSTTLPNCSTSGLWLCRQQKDQGSSIKLHQIDTELLDHIYSEYDIATLDPANSMTTWGSIFAKKNLTVITPNPSYTYLGSKYRFTKSPFGNILRSGVWNLSPILNKWWSSDRLCLTWYS